MKILKGFLVLLLLWGSLPEAWAADPVQEVRDIASKRSQAFREGNLDALMADVADNAVYTPSRSGFRIEGKPAMRAYFAQLFQNYPTRQNRGAQGTYRVFQNDTVVVFNGYQDQTFFDRSGYMSPAINRVSATWVKTEGRWLLVDHHFSRMPGTQ